MKKMSVTTTLALLLVLILGSTVAYAGVNWSGDPIFKVEGTIVNVTVDAENEINPSKTSVVLRVPRGVEAEIVDALGFDCKIEHRGRANGRGGIPVRVAVRVPRARPRFNVWVTVDVPEYGISESRQGKAGQQIKVRVDIPRN